MGDMPPGSVFAGHRIEAVAGRGGMGVVYRARQLSLDRVVALKVIAPALTQDDAIRRRFLRESRVAASIDHPHVIPIYYTGEEDGVAYIAMRHVAGDDLRTLVRRSGPLEPGQAARIVGQVAAALDAAHASGLVHRDVKPANVLLGPGRARLPDRLRADQARPLGGRDDEVRATGWGRSTSSRPSRSAASASTRARTSTRSAACCTTCSPAGRRSRPTATRRSCGRTCPSRRRGQRGGARRARGVRRRDRARARQGAGRSASSRPATSAARRSPRPRAGAPAGRDTIVATGAAAPIEVDTRTAGTALAPPPPPPKAPRRPARRARSRPRPPRCWPPSPSPGSRCAARASSRARRDPATPAAKPGMKVPRPASAGARTSSSAPAATSGPAASSNPRLDDARPRHAEARTEPRPEIGVGLLGLAAIRPRPVGAARPATGSSSTSTPAPAGGSARPCRCPARPTRSRPTTDAVYVAVTQPDARSRRPDPRVRPAHGRAPPDASTCATASAGSRSSAAACGCSPATPRS